MENIDNSTELWHDATDSTCGTGSEENYFTIDGDSEFGGASTASELSQESKQISSRSSHQCSWCGLLFDTVEQLKKHEKIHVVPNPRFCDQCGKLFRYPSALIVHMRSHTGERPFMCKLCGKCFSSSRVLVVHERTHAKEKKIKKDEGRKDGKVYACDDCPKIFLRPGELKSHRRIHTGEKPFKCEFCGKEMGYRSNYVNHLRTHTGEKPYKCDICGRGFASLTSFESHKSTHEDPKKASNSSGKCTKRYDVNPGKYPFQCNYCNKTYSKPEYLEQHHLSHINGTEDRPFICNTCGKSFIALRFLNIHMRIHTGERPYKCDVCDKAFTQRSSWKIHTSTHEERTCMCSLCNRRFFNSHALKRHMLIHSELKKCRYCDKMVKDSCRARHERNYHGDTLFNCSICSKTFSSKRVLREHVRVCRSGSEIVNSGGSSTSSAEGLKQVGEIAEIRDFEQMTTSSDMDSIAKDVHDDSSSEELSSYETIFVKSEAEESLETIF